MSKLEGLMKRNERWMYSGGHPNRTASFLNGLWARVGTSAIASHWYKRLVTLEVTGRTSGRPISFPLIASDLDGQRYLVSMLGEQANWVANVRAAGGAAVLRQRGRQPVHLTEIVDPAKKAPIIRRHQEVAPAARSFVALDRRAPLSEWARIADQIPVFRIDPPAEPVWDPTQQ